MYTYTFSNDDTDELVKSTKNYQDIFNGFAEVDKKYSTTITPPEFEKQTFVKPTDDEISENATSQLKEYKESGVKDIEKQYNDKTTAIDEKIQTAKADGESQKAETIDLYSSLKKDAGDDALKRGLARSSIVINVLDAFDKNMIKKYEQIGNEITSKINNFNTQISMLEDEKSNALNNFDLNYAIKLDEKISTIKSDLDKQEKDVIKYNNEIEKIEADYEEKKRQEIKEYAEYVEENGEDAIEKLIQKEKYKVALDYIKDLSYEDAIKIVESDDMITNIGSMNVNALKVYLKSKK